MNKTYLTILFNVVKNKKSILQLRRQQLSFKQIVELTDFASKEGFINYINSQITLTELGEDFLKENIDLIKKRNKEDWIEKDSKNKVKPFSQNEVFLPDRSEFSF